MSERKKKVIAYMCVGKHSRSTDLDMNEEQRVMFGCVMEDLKKVFDKLFFSNWSDFEIKLYSKALPLKNTQT